MFGDGRRGTIRGVSTAAPRLPHLRRLDDLMQKFDVVAWQKDLNASDAPIFIGSTLLATIRAPRSAKETAMQIDAGTLRRALKNLVRLGPMQPKRPMLEHVLFEPTWNRPHGTDITTQTVIATATISPFTS